jgi:hypothetical protein
MFAIQLPQIVLVIVLKVAEIPIIMDQQVFHPVHISYVMMKIHLMETVVIHIVNKKMVSNVIQQLVNVLKFVVMVLL